MSNDDIEKLVEATAEGSHRPRQHLFRTISSEEVFFPYREEQREGKVVKSTPLARLSDGTHAMMLFTSKAHPHLLEHQHFAGGRFKDALAAALKIPALDWVILWNSASERVVIAKNQILEILSDIDAFSQNSGGSISADQNDPATAKLEDIITNTVNSKATELPRSIGAAIGNREVFLELSKAQSQDGQPVLKTFGIEHLGSVVRAYTSRVRPGIRYGGMSWPELKRMIRNAPELAGVQLVNDADDWLVFDRQALGLNSASES